MTADVSKPDVSKPDVSSLDALRRHYDGGGTVAAVVDEVRARLAALGDPAVFIGPLAPDLDTRAVELDALGPADRAGLRLFGIPVAVKDNIDVAGMVTTAACPAFGRTAPVDAEAVALLRAAGAVVVGKTNLDQFATGLVGTRSPYGTPRNHLDPEIVPGGSSSGSAVAVAAGVVPVALGTDTAGSGRVPAAMNQVVGLKPTRGTVSTVGVVPACASLDCVSVFAGTVGDAWEVLSVLDAPSSDPWRRRDRRPRPRVAPDRLRVGIPVDPGELAAEIRASFDRVIRSLVDAGATPVPVDLDPFLEAGRILYGGPFVSERFASVGRFAVDHPDALVEPTRSILSAAVSHSAADYHVAQRSVLELRERVAPTWESVDVLVVPSVPEAPTLAAVAADPVGVNSHLGRFTTFANLLDLCAVAVPDVADRRPGAGVTIYGPADADAAVAAVGALVCDEPGLGPVPGCVDLVVVGAHLDGQPLNHELVDRGATLDRRTTTTAAYRLWALPDGRRPALSCAGDGAPIAVEVWSMPEGELGSFVAGVSRPLAIGHVDLADGTRPLGFVCEVGGLADAVDITSHGGWLSYRSG